MQAALDEAGIDDVIRAHAPFVGRTLRYLGVRESDLEDVCQEVFLIVHRRRDSYRERGSLRSWLYAITLRVARNHRRSNARRRETPMEIEDRAVAPDQEQHLERKERRALAQRILSGLTETQREILVLHEIEQLSMAEIAALLEISPKTGYSRLRLARQAMQRALARATLRGER